MISYLEGRLLEKLDDRIVVLAAGVGYEVMLPAAIRPAFGSRSAGRAFLGVGAVRLPMADGGSRMRRDGFTLIELMVAISVISILMTLVMPALGRARSVARSVHCSSNLRQLASAWQLYGDDYRGYCMPQVWYRASPPIFWWGANGNPADYEVGFLRPYLEEAAGIDNVFDCPEQPWGSYIPQGAARGPTTTYGYNGLYLAPQASGWGVASAKTHWKTIGEIAGPSQVFVFADTALDWTGHGRVSNNCYIDGPMVPWGSSWNKNGYPTLRFRHQGRAIVAFADTHVDAVHRGRAHITSTAAEIGYVGDDPAPHYVPDWREWF